MCRPVQCPACGKPSFAGCGMHVEQVLGHFAPAERCKCHEPRAKADKPNHRPVDRRPG